MELLPTSRCVHFGHFDFIGSSVDQKIRKKCKTIKLKLAREANTFLYLYIFFYISCLKDTLVFFSPM